MLKLLTMTLALCGLVLALTATSCRDDSGDGDSDADVRSDSDGGGDAGDGDVDSGGEVIEYPRTNCTDELPENGSACTDEGLSCWWQRCEEAEPWIIQGVCETGAWALAGHECTDNYCGSSEACGLTEICLEVRGGALMMECRGNPCDTGAFEASCACSLCGADECRITGTTVICDTCPSGDCA